MKRRRSWLSRAALAPPGNKGRPGTPHWLVWHDRHGAIDLDATLGWMPADDLHAAYVIGSERPGLIHYVSRDATWYLWDGTCHRPSTAEHVLNLVVAPFAGRMELALRDIRAVAGSHTGLPLDDRPRAKKALEAELWAPARRYSAGLRKSAGAGRCWATWRRSSWPTRSPTASPTT